MKQNNLRFYIKHDFRFYNRLLFSFRMQDSDLYLITPTTRWGTSSLWQTCNASRKFWNWLSGQRNLLPSPVLDPRGWQPRISPPPPVQKSQPQLTSGLPEFWTNTHPQPFFFYLCEALHGHTHPLTVTQTIPTNQRPNFHTDLNPSLTTTLKPSLFPQTGVGHCEDQPECPWKTAPKNVLTLIVEWVFRSSVRTRTHACT